MTPTCYAQRLLNPFRGVMNIIEYEGAEAVTTDGLHWDIYVRDTTLVEDLADGHKVQTSDIRYGSWSEKQGLKRGAIYPSDDFKMLEHRGAILYEYLLDHATRGQLEKQATARALAVQKHCRLYPSIVDTEAIKAARVEALLRANEPANEDSDETMATYYIELNVTRTN